MADKFEPRRPDAAGHALWDEIAGPAPANYERGAASAGSAPDLDAIEARLDELVRAEDAEAAANALDHIVRQLVAELRSRRRLALSGSEGTCEWKADDDGVYDTQCGGRWFFDSGTPNENKAKFCPYCGKTLRAATQGSRAPQEGK